MNPDTLVLNYTHVVVYTQSSLVEQSTPRAINISDSVASVSGVQFVDEAGQQDLCSPQMQLLDSLPALP